MSRHADNDDTVRTVTDVIESLAHTAPDRAAVVTMEETGPTITTRADLYEAVSRLGSRLNEDGDVKGERVAVCGETSLHWLTAALAVIRGGGVVVPVDAQMGDDVLTHVLEDSAPCCLFTDKAHQDRVGTLDLDSAPRVMLLGEEPEDEGSRQRRSAPAPEADPEAETVLFYTSGTTGMPKGVPLTHGNLVFQLHTILDSKIATASDRLLVPLPLHHVYPFVMGLLAPLAVGAAIVIPGSATA